jgi:hypothetical protein
MGRCAIALPLILVAAAGLGACGEARRHASGDRSPISRAQSDDERAASFIAKRERERLTWPEDRKVFMDAARVAWAFVDRGERSATGFIAPLGTYPFATIWDVGSMLEGLYAAHGLGLIDDAHYASRVDAILSTLTRVQLSGDRVFNKAYDTRTGALPHFGHTAAGHGAGWSATDVGRLLIWLKIVGSDKRFTQKAEAAVRRNDFSSVVKSGYLWGQDVDERGRTHTYQEGHIGYEQYAAHGFELWGYRADKALDLNENALPISVMGQPLVADYRRWDRLTSEPFLLWGLEVGWDWQTAALARRLLLAQEARYKKAGVLTMTGEDALPQPPHFFYYYCVYADGRDFAVDVQDRRAVADGPRWISAKSVFAFHALMPTRYTQTAVEALRDAQGPSGWASGVYENSGRSTGESNLNTAAVILGAALVHQRGEPLLAQAAHQ